MSAPHPGVFVRQELAQRGWIEADLAEIIGRSPQWVSRLACEKIGLSPRAVKELSDAFGTGTQIWVDRWVAYQLDQLATYEARHGRGGDCGGARCS